jgi:hypothetical protein
MQSALFQCLKDTFYATLRDRLVALNPQRTVFVEGVERPAILVVENELITFSEMQLNAFYLHWSDSRVLNAPAEPAALLEVGCAIEYATEGDEEFNGQNRGRSLAALDEELFSIVQPTCAALLDFESEEPQDLGARIFWGLPEYEKPGLKGRRFTRRAHLKLHLFAEERGL